MSPEQQRPILMLTRLRRISLVCASSFIIFVTLLTTARLHAQTATLPPGIGSFNISLQSTLTDVDHFQLAPPYLYTVHGTTFTVYDISDLSAPAAINTMNLLSVTTRFEYSGTLAYLLQEQSTPSADISNSELWVLDLATPSSTITKTVYAMTTWNNNPNTGDPFHDAIVDIAPFDEYLLMSHVKGEDVGMFGGAATLTLLDLSASPTPTVVSTNTLPGAIYDMQIIDDNYVLGQRTAFYSGPTGYVQEYYLLNFENKLEPLFLNRYRLKRPDHTPLDLFIHEDQTYLYTVEYPEQAEHATPCDALAWTPLALNIRNLTDPTDPVHEGFYSDPTYPGKVTCDQRRPFHAIDGYNQVMAAAIDDTLYLLDRTDPTNLFALGHIPVEGSIDELQVNDGVIAARTGNTIQLYRYAEAAIQSRYLDQSIDHQFFMNQMGFFIPQNSFTQPISLTVQTYNIDQTAPITGSLYATYPLYRITTIDPNSGDVITPTTSFSLEANHDSLNFGQPLDADILGQTLSFYRWKNGGWQKVPSVVVNGDTRYPTVSAQVDRSGIYTVLSQKAQRSYLPLIEQ